MTSSPSAVHLKENIFKRTIYPPSVIAIAFTASELCETKKKAEILHRIKYTRFFYYYYCEFTQLTMLKLVSSLAPGDNKFPREAKTHPLFVFLSTLHLQYLPKDPCRPQQCTFLDQFNRNAHINDLQISLQPQWY